MRSLSGRSRHGMSPPKSTAAGVTMWTFEEKAAIGFGLAFVLLAASGMVARPNTETQRIRRASYLTMHSNAVMEHAERVLSEIKDAETGQSGFVITGDEVYLESFTQGSAAVAGTMDELHKLTADNPEHQKRLGEVEALIAWKLDEMRKTIGQRRTEGFEAAQKETRNGKGKRYMDSLRRVIDQMERSERDLLKLRAAEVRASASRSRNSIDCGILVSLMVATTLAFFLARSLVSPIGPGVRSVAFRSVPLHRSTRINSWQRATRSAVRALSRS